MKEKYSNMIKVMTQLIVPALLFTFFPFGNNKYSTLISGIHRK